MAKKVKRTTTRKQGKTAEVEKVAEVIAAPPKKSNAKAVVTAVIIAVIVLSIPLYLNGKKAAEIKANKILSEVAGLAVTTSVVFDAKTPVAGCFRVQNPNVGKIQQLYMSIITDLGSTKAYPVALLGLADSYCDYNRFQEAWDNYNSFIEKFPRHALLPEAIVGRGDVVYKQGKYDMAQAEWGKVLKNYNGGKNKYCVELKLADCDLKLGNKDAAKALCEDVIKDSKDGSWADMAKALLATIK